MSYQIDTDLLNELKHFYKKLEFILCNEKIKIYDDSIFITLIKVSPNKISKLLSGSALKAQSFYDPDLRKLEENDYITEVNDIKNKNYYVITAHGIWVYENYLNKISIDKLMNFYQKTKFSSVIGKKPLSNIEKLILTSLIAIRNFSKKTAMDLNDKNKQKQWIGIFNDTAEFLSKKGYISNSNWMPSKQGIEPPINYIMRRAQDLPQKSKHVYSIPGNYNYFLELNKEEEPSIRLKFLFSIILIKLNSKSDIDEIYTFLSTSAYNKAKNVRSDFDFVNPDWDSIIKKALTDFYYDQLSIDDTTI
jgi:hypothetical protein